MEKVFLTDDIEIIDFESDNLERYTFTKQELDPADYGQEKEDFEDWAEDNLTFEELYEVPMMNALRYFPSFISFQGDEKTAGTTCLLYDNELERWAVGMTDGGMDLAPHLLDTFLMLDKGVPAELAPAIRRDYPAYVDKDKHVKNCDILAKAMREYGNNWIYRAERLEGKK